MEKNIPNNHVSRSVLISRHSTGQSDRQRDRRLQSRPGPQLHQPDCRHTPPHLAGHPGLSPGRQCHRAGPLLRVPALQRESHQNPHAPVPFPRRHHTGNVEGLVCCGKHLGSGHIDPEHGHGTAAAGGSRSGQFFAGDSRWIGR